MSDEHDLRVVFRTSHHEEAASLAEKLAEAGIPSEARLVVQASREKDALLLIEGYMQSIGAAAHEEKPPAAEEGSDLLPCPNCEAVGIRLGKSCPGCSFRIWKAAEAPVSVHAHTPEARSFCPECREPFTLEAGNCADCVEELEPLEGGDRLCPALTHVLYRDTVGGFVCKACRGVWVDVAPG